MMAQRYGRHPVAYAHSRTQQQFVTDVEAWQATWAFPATVLLRGNGRPDGSPSGDTPRSSPRGLPSWYKMPHGRVHARSLDEVFASDKARGELRGMVSQIGGQRVRARGGEKPTAPKLGGFRRPGA